MTDAQALVLIAVIVGGIGTLNPRAGFLVLSVCAALVALLRF